MPATNIYLPSDNLNNMIIKCIIWGLLAIILGTIVNNIFVHILNNINYKPNIIVEILLQLILCCIILSIIHINFNYFGWTWQHTTPGFIFVSFFFGAQYNVFTNMQKRFIIDRK